MTREERQVRKLAREVRRRVAAAVEAQLREARGLAARGARAKPFALSESTRAGNLRWRRAHPEGSRAHKQVYAAVRAGRIPRPDRCEGCGLEKRLHGHHEDYAKPLQVRWLCGSCHRLAHSALCDGTAQRRETLAVRTASRGEGV